MHLKQAAEIFPQDILLRGFGNTAEYSHFLTCHHTKWPVMMPLKIDLYQEIKH